MKMGRESKVARRNHRTELLVYGIIVKHGTWSNVHHIADTLLNELNEKCSLARANQLAALVLIGIF